MYVIEGLKFRECILRWFIGSIICVDNVDVYENLVANSSYLRENFETDLRGGVCARAACVNYVGNHNFSYLCYFLTARRLDSAR